ncbi:PREDICTED: aspartic proteinase A2-like [Diuraphis noxia]|uniref:aspartic proteinase A2-like n=1 Tax=Diuraphis noxia TaxID=143948 RepID=UPI00076374A2|nr:PREDICTED: aspartic proteinase A2-like [Diuraphis noxia]
MMYRLILFVVFYNVFCTTNADVEMNVHRIPLVRRKSPLEMLIKDPHYTKKLNIQKTHPTNENITLFKYLDMGHLNVSNLIFAGISEIPNYTQYQMMHADGIIGLGYNTMARTTNQTFFYKLLDDKKILKPIFSVYMNRDETTNKGGVIFLGGIEPKHINGEITYVPVTIKKYWQIEMNQ